MKACYQEEQQWIILFDQRIGGECLDLSGNNNVWLVCLECLR